jgi:hypothetical protein
MAEMLPTSANGEQPAQFPLPAGQIVAAIYRIVFGRPGDHDVFANALVRWVDFIVPVILFLGLHLVYETQRDVRVAHVMAISARAAGIVLGVLAAGTLLRLVVASAATWVLARGLAAPERVSPGLLGYVWMEAALVAPGVIILRGAVSGHTPVWMVVVFGFGSMLFLFYGAARVMRVAFGLSNIGLGVLFALAGSIISYVIDQLLPW